MAQSLNLKKLTRKQADDIVRVVSADPECRKRIGSSFWSYLPPDMKVAGSLRNISMMIASGDLFSLDGVLGRPGRMLSDEEVAAVCTGIAAATSSAISKAKIEGVTGASTCVRDLRGTAHDATRVDMQRLGAVVFDWHATLRIGNPIIYRSVIDWSKDVGGEVYSSFTGF